LYIQLICYRTKMTGEDIIEELKPYRALKVIADSADPRLIDKIHAGGIKIYPVSKPAGSIVAGLSEMSEYEIFIVEPSYELVDECRNYVWGKDKDGKYINEPADGQADHAIDATRYYVYGHILGKIKKSKSLEGVF
ncbi:MAG: PBSX family phage terminase large subunit, partial [Tannerellaceae bacterium]